MSSILLIDTSLQGAIVGCLEITAGKIAALQGLHHHDLMGSAEALPDLVAEVLRKSCRSIGDLDGIVVSVGPGSFTGIKVGLSFAYGLRKAMQTKAPEGQMLILGMSALKSCATEHGRNQDDPQFDLIVPATKTHGFGVHWNGTTGDPRLIALASYRPNPETAIVTAGEWPELGQDNISAGTSRYTLSKDQVYDATLRGMSEKAVSAWPVGFSLDNPEPSYLRLSTAEEALANSQKK